MSSPPSGAQHRVLIATLGPLFLGTVAMYFFWGIQVAQTYYYYRSFRKTDQLWIKLAVSFLFLIDLVQSSAASAAGWRYLVDLWGDPLFAFRPDGWGPNLTNLTDGLAAACVQCFYAQKLWVLYEKPYNHLIVAVIAVMALAQVVSGVGTTIFMFTSPVSLAEFGKLNVWAGIGQAVGGAADILITFLMTLRLSQRRTGFKKTDDLISKLILIIMETGLASAVVQLVLFGLFIGRPKNTYFVVPLLIAPKIYSNSMLAVLNSRTTKSDNEPSMIDSNSFNKMHRPLDIRTTQTVEIAGDYGHKDSHSYELQDIEPARAFQSQYSHAPKQTAPRG